MTNNVHQDVVSAGPLRGSATVQVWDLVVRLFHWTVAIGCFANSFVFTDGKDVHQVIGYLIAGALAIRFVWGFVGTRYARFTSFFPGPRTLGTYVAMAMRGREPRHIGHNPLAALMIFALMGLLAGLSVTGWMMGLDAFWGEEWLMSLHTVMANTLLVLAAVHISAAIYESLRHRENLVWAMVTGRKRV